MTGIRPPVCRRVLVPARIRLCALHRRKPKCPPEDVGGVGGYQEFLEAIFDPSHEDHSRFLTWAGGYFQADEFDPAGVNAQLRGKRWPEMYLR